jgi:hypothetical protein
MTSCPRWSPRGWALAVGFSAALILAATSETNAQLQYAAGQNIAPDFAGWEANPDGSFNLVFGYLNRNYEEHLSIPLGPNNKFEPGEVDRGQPTYFLPRRNRHVFRVRVPADFGSQELVWTVAANGKTDRAYASLRPDYALDAAAVYLNNSGYTMVGKALKNEPPVVKIEGEMHRIAKVGVPTTLTADVSDDGVPRPRAAPRMGIIGLRSAMGLRVAWFVYRGQGDSVRFSPEQFKVYADYADASANSPWSPGWVPPPIPPDGKYSVQATFHDPGTYVVRVQAHDGGFDTAQDVTVTVQPAAGAVTR